MMYNNYIVGGVLYHHGIHGQKWGKRNGPPYPLGKDVSTGKRLKVDANKQGGLVSNYKMKKLTKYNGKMINKIKSTSKTDEEKDRRLRELDKEVLYKSADIALKSNGFKRVGKSDLYVKDVYRKDEEDSHGFREMKAIPYSSSTYDKDRLPIKEYEKYLKEVSKDPMKYEKLALKTALKGTKYEKFKDMFTDYESDVEMYEFEPNGDFTTCYVLEDGDFAISYNPKTKKTRFEKDYYRD